MRHYLVSVAMLTVFSASVFARAGTESAEPVQSKAAITRLINELKSETPQTRIAAADALGKIGAEAKGAVPALLEAATTEHAWIDTAMLAAVQQIGPAAVPILLELLEHGQPKIRARAATALWITDGER